jgi:hypothetical protein
MRGEPNVTRYRLLHGVSRKGQQIVSLKDWDNNTMK